MYIYLLDSTISFLFDISDKKRDFKVLQIEMKSLYILDEINENMAPPCTFFAWNVKCKQTLCMNIKSTFTVFIAIYPTQQCFLFTSANNCDDSGKNCIKYERE